MAYASLADYKSAFPGRGDDGLDDGRIPDVLDVASAEVDEWCQRSFTVAGSATARTFRQTSTGVVMVDDFSTLTGLIVVDDTSTLTIGEDFHVDRPTVTSHPFYRIRFSPYRWQQPSWEPLLSITAAWGWLAVPAQVARATVLLAGDLMRPVAHGVLGLDVGAPFRVGTNRDVVNMLAAFRRGDRTGL